MFKIAYRWISVPAFVYRCPNTARNVQGFVAEELDDDVETYQAIECIACTRVHLVDPKTGKVLGGKNDK